MNLYLKKIFNYARRYAIRTKRITNNMNYKDACKSIECILKSLIKFI